MMQEPLFHLHRHTHSVCLASILSIFFMELLGVNYNQNELAFLNYVLVLALFAPLSLRPFLRMLLKTYPYRLI